MTPDTIVALATLGFFVLLFIGDPLLVLFARLHRHVQIATVLAFTAVVCAFVLKYG